MEGDLTRILVRSSLKQAVVYTSAYLLLDVLYK